MVLFGVGLVLFIVFTESEAGFLILLVFLPVAWVLMVVLALNSPDKARSVQTLVKSFYRQVDKAKQQLANDPKSIDEKVQSAFDKLHAEVQSLLQSKKIKITQLKREVMRFHSPDKTPDSRWQPPSLSEMGYVLVASDVFSPDAPVLALYKFSGEERSRNGAVADTYTILKEGSSVSFSPTFKAKIQSPFPNQIVAVNRADAAHDAAVNAGPKNSEGANSDHNVGYILSLLGPVTPSNVNTLEENLRAMAGPRAEAVLAEPSPAMSVWGDLRSLLTDAISHQESSLQMARKALRQEPQLMICAVTDVHHDSEDNRKMRGDVFEALADVLMPPAESSRPEWVALMTDLASNIHAFAATPVEQAMEYVGIAYVEARGAEADAGFLNRVAQLLVPSTQVTNEQARLVFMTTNLSAEEFRTQLRGYSALDPGEAALATLTSLLAALDVKQLILNTVDGDNPVKASDFLHSVRGKIDRCLFFSANPALVDLEDIEFPMRYMLWTLSGRVLEVPSDSVNVLTETAQKIRACALRPSSAATS